MVVGCWLLVVGCCLAEGDILPTVPQVFITLHERFLIDNQHPSVVFFSTHFPQVK